MSNLALTGADPVRTDPFPEWPVYNDESIAELTTRLRAGDRADQDPVLVFEQMFAEAHGARYGVGCNSGTSALEIAIQALRLERGSEIIVSPITFFASVSAILNSGCVPVFADIDPETYNIDPKAIEAVISPRTAALMAVHFGGVSCDMEALLDLGDRYSVPVIEDAAHAHGGTWKDRGLGSIGAVGCFSFGSGKNLSAAGGGGLITNDPIIYERASGYGELNHPRRQERRATTGVNTVHTPEEEYFPYSSGNRRMHPVHAVLGLPQLAQLGEQTERRDTNGRYLSTLLDDVTGITPRKQDAFATRAANHLFVMRYTAKAFGGLTRSAFIAALKAEGIPCDACYIRPMHHADLFANHDEELSRVWPHSRDAMDLEYVATACPYAEQACAEEMVTLPTNVLLDNKAGMENIFHAIEKIQTWQSELENHPLNVST